MRVRDDEDLGGGGGERGALAFERNISLTMKTIYPNCSTLWNSPPPPPRSLPPSLPRSSSSSPTTPALPYQSPQFRASLLFQEWERGRGRREEGGGEDKTQAAGVDPSPSLLLSLLFSLSVCVCVYVFCVCVCLNVNVRACKRLQKKSVEILEDY